MKNLKLSTILIADRDPTIFLKRVIKAIHERHSVALLNPHWQSHEQHQVQEIFADQLGGDTARDIQEKMNGSDEIWCIPTGGTSGKIKFTVHNRATLSASVTGFQQFFRIEQVHCFCVLPLYHVSGLMQVWRSQFSGGKFELGDYAALKQGILPDIDVHDFCISLVPTQLQVLLTVCPQWLTQFRLVLLGGAPPWRSLLDQARQWQIPVALTYGMTETASQVVALKPADFLAGKNCAGQVLPHAQVGVTETGLIQIQSASLFLGYYPNLTYPQSLTTDDLGYWDEAGYLHLLGRHSHKIISGGENIYPAEVEAVIFGTNLVVDVAVLGVPDRYWGEAVMAVLVLKNGVQLTAVQQAIATQFSRYKQPKYWQVVEQLPRNVQGKLNRDQLQQLIRKDY